MRIFLRGQLTVYFDAPFWVGVFERTEDGALQVCRVTFGSEPKDQEIYDFVLNRYADLKFSAPVQDLGEVNKRVNPKRLKRQIQKATQAHGIRTKAQEAIQMQREANKVQRKQSAKAERMLQKKIDFEMKQLKKKQKKRGH